MNDMLKVYYLKISDCVSISEQYLLEKVGKNTRKEVSTYSNEQVRRQKCLGEAMCRELIETLWTLQPEAYAIVRTEHGKPMVQGVPAVYFNLTDAYVRYDLDGIKDYVFWFAQHEGTYPAFYYKYNIWQYSDCGKVNGIDGNVDLNIMFNQ